MRRPGNAMFNDNVLKLGIFSPNCSGGMAITTMPERWDSAWENNKALAMIADEAASSSCCRSRAGSAMGGSADFQGHNLETITWATGLLA